MPLITRNFACKGARASIRSRSNGNQHLCEHRDLIYDRILVHLSGIDGVWLAAREKDFEAADRLSREYCDELHLLTNDLGWGERSGGEPVELSSPPDLVRRVMQRLRGIAEVEDAQEQKEIASLREAIDENRQLREVCDEVLVALESP